jgi:hypothetical protein
MKLTTDPELEAELAERRGEVLVAVARLTETFQKLASTDVGRYHAARVACEVAKIILEQHDLPKLLDAIARADSFGAIVDPTLYRSKVDAMLEDRDVFSAALRFRGTWRRR